MNTLELIFIPINYSVTPRAVHPAAVAAWLLTDYLPRKEANHLECFTLRYLPRCFAHDTALVLLVIMLLFRDNTKIPSIHTSNS
jgi:hypothetical protein